MFYVASGSSAKGYKNHINLLSITYTEGYMPLNKSLNFRLCTPPKFQRDCVYALKELTCKMDKNNAEALGNHLFTYSQQLMDFSF